MKVPFVDLKKQYKNIKEEVDSGISNVLQGTQFILGGEVERFEQKWARFCGVNHAISVGSGTEALHLALKALGIGEGDEVITAANTYMATALAISYTGADPVLVDINPDSYNMNADQLEEAISPSTKAIIPVHLYGQSADMEPIIKKAKDNNLKVVEDACQAHGAEYKGNKVGSIGDLGCFSFYPSKNLGGYGDGGIIVTNDKIVAEKLRLLRNYGQKKKNYHLIKGFNSRLDTIQAAILMTKLAHLDDWNRARFQNAMLYNELLNNLEMVKVPEVKNKGKFPHVFHLYVVRAERRSELQKYLKQNGISTGIHYPLPIHLQPAYADLGYKDGDFPVTERYCEEIISLPMYPELREEQIRYVAQKIHQFYSGK